MTIKELYELARSEGREDAEIRISYDSDDEWYSLDKEPVTKERVKFGEIEDIAVLSVEQTE